MTTGRPPTPTERKRRTGNPGKRALPDATASPPLPALALDAPDHLGDAGRAAWMLLAAECSWLAHTDRVSVVLLCEKLDRRAAWIAQLAGADEVLLTDKGYAYPNPAIVGSTPVMLDVEPEGASKPTVADCAAFIARMHQLGGRVWGVYYPRWYWSQTGGDLASLGVALIASGYPGSYRDSDANWNAYGGKTPDVWQYTDKPYAGQSVDLNAYRGTTSQLADLINSTATTPTGDDAVTPYDIWAFKNAHLDTIDMRQRLVNAETAAEQARDQANAIKAELDGVNGKLDALINTINSLRTGGIDVGVLAGDITHAIGTKLTA